MNLTTKIAGVQLKNPTILASGILGVTGSSLVNVAKNDVGAVTTKSIGLEERKGHHNPIIVEFESGLINAVGLSNPGVDEFLEEISYAVKNAKVPVIASIFGRTINEFGIVAEKVSKAKPNFIEVNISCPNVEDEFGKPFGADAKTAAKITEIVKNQTKIPIIVKLTPNVPNIKNIAKAVEQAGADAVSAINTLGPGMMIDIKTAKPILANKHGGVSGPAIRPIAIRCVYDIYETVDIPIIGIGGIIYDKDAIEMIMAGASAVGIGSGIYYKGLEIFKQINLGISKFMQENGYSSIKEMVGIAHEQ